MILFFVDLQILFFQHQFIVMQINSRSYQGSQSGSDPKFAWCPQPFRMLLFCHGWLTRLTGPRTSLQGGSHEPQELCTDPRWKIKWAYVILNNLKYDWYLGWCITSHCNQTSTSSFPLQPLSVRTALAVFQWGPWSWFFIHHLLSSVGKCLSQVVCDDHSIVPFPSLCQMFLFS